MLLYIEFNNLISKKRYSARPIWSLALKGINWKKYENEIRSH